MERERLEGLLDRMGEGDVLARETLLDYIMQQPAGIRVLALEALRDGGDAAHDQLLLTLADDPALTVTPSVPAPEPLHPIAQMAAREWDAHHAEAGAPPAELLSRLQGSDRSTRLDAARALADYPAPAAISALADALAGSDLRVAAAALESLQRIGSAAIPALLPLLAHRDSQTRWHAAKAISGMADERAVSALIPLLQDRHSGTRWLAAEGLVHVGRPALVPLLRALASGKPDSWLRQGAAHVLGKLPFDDDATRQRYQILVKDLRSASASVIPDLARRELARLGVESEGGA